MPLIEWDERFELGVKQFDDHHKHFIGLLNKIYDYVTCDTHNDILEPVLVELIDYASYHFAAEEHWMGVHKFPGLEKHQEEHQKFSRRVVEIQKAFYAGKADITLDVLVFLKNWLSHHILNTDAEYGRFAVGLPHA
jgi:hemerythrin